jgi:hypothetical protein
MVKESDLFNKWVGLGLPYIVLLIPMYRHNLNRHPIFRVNNFLHDLRTQHKINGLGFRDITCLIKYVKLMLIYIVLYFCLNTIFFFENQIL